MLTDLERFPRYTCVQTVTRYYYRPHVQGASCAELMAEHQSPSKDRLRGWDRLRLEVAVADRSNVYSWVGAPRFESGTVDQLVRRGPFMEQRGGLTEYFRISIRFESIELNGKIWKMRAVPDVGLAIGVGVRDSSSVPSGDSAIERTSFFFRKEHLHLDKFDWNWMTTLPYPEDKTGNPDSEP